MADTHSVERHLSLSIADYDREIRRLVPHYDEMVREGLAVLEALVAPDARIVDLGTGTGRLAEALAGAMPRAHVIAVDVDPRMLEAAGTRLARFGERVTLAPQSFFEALPACDAVVASLSLHHVHELDRKVAVHRAIHDALRPGGVLVVLDATVSGDPRLSARTFTRWADAMAEHGIDTATAHGHFRSWSKEERYFSLAEELDALGRAGFAHPECFWRKGPVSVYGAIKST
ncbi:MAG: class I SAM-dependent methyltransferase [Deltaproteobacteria bacterium]|nr:class I SAM-dependent methyltransferase [Deltaproteobacteria bacterium]